MLDRAAALLAPLHTAGARWGHLELEFYVGQYDWTPIGIHRERCGNFHYVLLGLKEMLVWPRYSLAPLVRDAERARGGHSRSKAARSGLLDASARKVYRAGPGEMIYFPSEEWHVGVSPGLSVAVDMALFGVNRIVPAGLTLSEGDRVIRPPDVELSAARLPTRYAGSARRIVAELERRGPVTVGRLLDHVLKGASGPPPALAKQRYVLRQWLAELASTHAVEVLGL